MSRTHKRRLALRPQTLKLLRTAIRVHLKTFTAGRIGELDNTTRTVFYRVAQEALTNVERHAQASQVEVSIQKLQDCICMKIKDDGKSFQVEHALLAPGSKRLGLIGMRERLEMVGGRFDVESAPGKGTTIIAQIPFGKAAPEGTLKSSAETIFERL